MNIRRTILCLAVLSLGTSTLSAAVGAASAAAQAVNELGLDLLAKGTEPGANALLSPYSIQSALAMTFAGAAGATRAEMAKVLHYPGDEAELHRSFAALQQALENIQKSTAARAENSKKWGGPTSNPESKSSTPQSLRPRLIVLYRLPPWT
jgi:serine protease inhibitor